MSTMSELDIESTAKVKVTITTMDGEVLHQFIVIADAVPVINVQQLANKIDETVSNFHETEEI